MPESTSPSEASLTLSVLGFTLLRRTDSSGTSPVALSTGKPRGLLTFLHCAPAHTASREQLLELLWSDAAPESARHTLRQTLWYIKRKLGFDPLVTTGDRIRLALPITSDRDQFLAALDADNPAAAITHYSGDFFPEFAAPGGAAFEHWADVERTRLRSLFIGAATRVVRDALGKGHARDAIAVARRAHSLAPQHQGTWRLLLESQLAAGDTVGAAVEMERLERWLADDEPDAATTQLIKLVRSGKANGPNADAPIGSPLLQAELIGRETEFAELVAAVEDVRRAHSRHLHIVAPAGFGKTRLLDGFAARLKASRVRVVTVRASIAERNVPFAFTAQLASALVQLRGASGVSPDTARTLVGLAPSASNYLNAEADRTTGEDALRRRTMALSELITTIAHDAPLVLLADDVHWLDPFSRTVLASLATRSTGVSVLLVTAARTGDEFVDATPDARRLTLGPLSADNISALVTSIARLPEQSWSESLIASLYAGSRGSPLMILEELYLAMERDQLRIVDQNWIANDAAALCDTLAAGSASQARLAGLSAAARTAVLRIAITGTTVSDAMLQDVLDGDAVQTVPLLESRGYVVRRVSGWQTAHDEIATLAIDSAAKRDRQAAHDAIAAYLERIAEHDATLLQRAATHRANGGDSSALDHTFARTVRAASATGNLATIRQLGRGILGTAHANGEVEQLVRRLPWRIRHHARTWIASAIVGAGALLALGYCVLSSTPVVDREELAATIIAMDGEGPAFYSLSVRMDELTRPGPIELTATGEAFDLGVLDSVGVMGKLNDGSFVGSSMLRNDATRGVDLVRITRDGDVTRLLSEDQDQNHDQDSPSVSPDGKTVSFNSGRWHPDQRNEIAMFEVATRQVTRLTNSDHREIGPRWNASGTMLAFIRSWATDHAAEICWQPPRMAEPRCRALDAGLTPERIVAWSSSHALLVSARRLLDNQSMLIDADTAIGQQRVVDTTASRWDADPTGRLVLCLCQVEGYTGRVFAAFSPSKPSFKRVIRRDGRPLRALYLPYMQWNRAGGDLAVLAIEPRSEAFVGQRVQLSVRGTDLDSQEVAVTRAVWQSLDTMIATVDSLGMATLRAPGTARFRAQSGSVRSTATTVPVVPAHADVVINEHWTRPLGSRWHVFGTPRPTVVKEHGALFLFPDGDGNLTSGVLSKRTLGTNNGAGLRATVRLPITVAQWQALSLALAFVATDAALAEWTGREDGLFSASWNAAQGNRSCGVRVPRAEGGENLSRVAFTVGGQEVPLRTQPRIIDGLPHTIDLQILGDGRCGLAIDSVVVAVSSNSLKTDRPLRVWVDGQSVGTQIRVGAFEAWTGIRQGIDWSALPNAASVTRR